MPRFENPTILITRPTADAERFLAMLRADAGSFEVIMCPAFGFEEISTKNAHFDAAIFTSKAGVAYAPDGEGRVAYCVGDVTAQLAQDAGYTALSANGSAEDLVALILSHAPTVSLNHIRGEISRGNVTARLVARGINCTDVIAYRKIPQSPPVGVTEIVRSTAQLVLPLFSAETVSIIANWAVPLEGCMVVAISDVVAKSAQALNPAEVIVSERPDMRGMAAAIARLTA